MPSIPSSCRALSSRDAKCQRDAKFLRERFSFVSQTLFRESKNPVFPGKIRRRRSEQFGQFVKITIQDNGRLKSGQGPPRKFLWLIPFMVAKKLLTMESLAGVREFFLTVCGTKAHTTRAICRKENF